MSLRFQKLSNLPYVAPFLAAVLFATHMTNWGRQPSVIGSWPYETVYEVDLLSPNIPWFDPVFAALVVVALVWLVVRQRQAPRLRTFNHQPAAFTGLAALAVGVAGAIYFVFPFTPSLFADPLFKSLGLALALAFKLLSVVTVWRALQRSRRAEAASTQAQVNNRRFPFGAILVIAAAVLLLFPAREQLLSIVALLAGSALPHWLSPYATSGWGWSIDLLAAILIAGYLSHRGALDRVFLLPGSPRLIRVGLVFAALFLLAAPIALILSAIPYGGGHVPALVKSLFAVTQVIGIWVIYKGLFKETDR